jgi:hypothetical protein
MIIFAHLVINRVIFLEERHVEGHACANISETVVRIQCDQIATGNLQIVVPSNEELASITRLSKDFHLALSKAIGWVRQLSETEIEKEFFLQLLSVHCRTDSASDPLRVIQNFCERGYIHPSWDGLLEYHLPSALPFPGHYTSLPTPVTSFF